MDNNYKDIIPSVVYATQNGATKSIEYMSDPVFAQKTLGDGMFVIPTEGIVASPVKGKLIVVSETKHAYGILADDGAEILVHVGVDSVILNGKGFISSVKVGDHVDVGTLLCTIDLDIFENEQISSETAIVIANKDKFHIIKKYEHDTVTKSEKIFEYIRK